MCGFRTIISQHERAQACNQKKTFGPTSTKPKHTVANWWFVTQADKHGVLLTNTDDDYFGCGVCNRVAINSLWKWNI